MKSFAIGCNYWASHAGMYMWRRFDASIVEKDFALLSKNGVNTLRIFPLWPDFQPIDNQLIAHRRPFPFRNGDEPLKTPAGLDEKQIENFGIVLDLAEKYHLKVIVALITGWMSGRLFVPPFLMNKNPVNDPLAIVWECRFIREFIPHFIDRKCIIAWEPGNECNVLDGVLMQEHGVTPAQAELWLSAITNAIRASDSSRPIYSGMHFTRINNDWNASMLALYTDMQTTHPYPAFTDHCDREGLNEMRASLHAAAESVYVSDISNQPCMVEEIGSLSPITLSDDYLPEYIEKSLFSSFQYNTTGYLWWCAFEQNALDFAPYDLTACERELGLAHPDYTVKPNLIALNKMGKVVEEIGELPPHQKDAVVILTERDRWGADWTTSYGSFCLAAQAGRNVKFSHHALPLEDSNHYILCLAGDIHLKYHAELLKKIENGAKLFISFHGGYMSNFELLTGLKVAARERRNVTHTFTFNGKEISLSCPINLVLNADKANVLARDQEGNIVLSENKIGKGCVYFLNAALENSYTTTYKPTETDMSELYSFFLQDVHKPIEFNTKHCAITYHEYSPEKIGVMITNFSENRELGYTLDKNYTIEKTMYSDAKNGVLKLKERFACVFLKKNN